MTFKKYHSVFEGKKLSWKLYDAAEKPTLVLLHGFCEDAGVWDDILPQLICAYQIIIPDLPGFGESEVQQSQTMESMAAAVKYIIEEAAVDRPVMIGHSMGGYITLAFVSKYKNILGGFGLFHSTALPDSEEKKENRLKTIDFIRTHGSGPFAAVLVPTLFAPKAAPQVVEKALQRGSLCAPEGLCAAAMAMRARPDYSFVLRETNLPVLIIAGQYDAGIPVSVSARQASYPGTSSFYILASSGHCGMVEEPEPSAQIIKTFTQFCQSYHYEN